MKPVVYRDSIPPTKAKWSKSTNKSMIGACIIMLPNFLHNLTQPDQRVTTPHSRLCTDSNTEERYGSTTVAPESHLNAVQFLNPHTMAPTYSVPVSNMIDPFNLPPGLEGPMDGIPLPEETSQTQTIENFAKDLMPDNYTGLLFTTANSLAKAINWAMALWYDNNAAQGGQDEAQKGAALF